MRRIIGYNSHELPDGHPDKYPPVAEVVRPDPPTGNGKSPACATSGNATAKMPRHYLARLKQVALQGGNVFGELLETVRHATLGQISRTLAEVGGQYRKMV